MNQSRRRLVDILLVLAILALASSPVLLNFFLDGVRTW